MNTTRTARNTAKTRGAIYVRISDDKATGTADEGLGVQRQEASCLKTAASLGLTVAPENMYRENDASAYSGKSRPEFLRLLADIQAGRVDAVVCYHVDRLYRRLDDFVKYSVSTVGIPTHGVTSGPVDLSTASGRRQALDLAGMAAFESERRSERLTDYHEQSAELGKYRGGTTGGPFGYDQHGMTRHPVEAAMIEAACRDLLGLDTDGPVSLGAIVRRWNESGVKTRPSKGSPEGKLWNYSTLKQVLTRPRNYGASVYKGEVVGIGQWEPIVTEDVHRSVLALLSNPARRKSQSNRGRWLLSGLAICGVCGEREVTNTVKSATAHRKATGETFPIYRCRSSLHIARKTTLLDEYVTSVVLGRLARPDARDLLVQDVTRPDMAVLRTKAAAIRARTKDALDLFTEGTLTKAEFATLKRTLDAELATAEAAMVSPARSAALSAMIEAADPAARWELLSWSQRRTVIDALCTVTLLPVPRSHARVFAPEFVTFDWL